VLRCGRSIQTQLSVLNLWAVDARENTFKARHSRGQ
jgi:hypothetical protein